MAVVAGRVGLGSLRALQVGLVGRSVGKQYDASVGWAHYRWSSGGRSVAGIRHSQLPGFSGACQVLLALEVLKQVCITRVDLASGQSSVHDLGDQGLEAA